MENPGRLEKRKRGNIPEKGERKLTPHEKMVKEREEAAKRTEEQKKERETRYQEKVGVEKRKELADESGRPEKKRKRGYGEGRAGREHLRFSPQPSDSGASNAINKIGERIDKIGNINRDLDKMNKDIENSNEWLKRLSQEASTRDGEQSSDTGDGQNERRIQVRDRDEALTRGSISTINETLAKFDNFTPNGLQQKRVIDFLDTQCKFLNRNDVPGLLKGQYGQVRKDIIDRLRRLLNLDAPDFEGATGDGDGGDDDAPAPDSGLAKKGTMKRSDLSQLGSGSEGDDISTRSTSSQDSDRSHHSQVGHNPQQNRVNVDQIEPRENDTLDEQESVAIINKKLKVLNKSGGIDRKVADFIRPTIDLLQTLDSSRMMFLRSVSKGLNSIESESTVRDAIDKIYGMEKADYTMDSTNREIENFNRLLGGSHQEASTRDGEQSSNTGDGQNVRRIQVRDRDDALTLSSISTINETLAKFDEFTPNDRRQKRVMDFLDTQVEFLNRNDVPLQHQGRYRQVRRHILVDRLRRLLDLDYNPDFEEARGGGDDDAPPPGPGPGGPTVKIRLHKPQEVQVESTTADNTTAGNTRVTNN